MALQAVALTTPFHGATHAAITHAAFDPVHEVALFRGLLGTVTGGVFNPLDAVRQWELRYEGSAYAAVVGVLNVNALVTHLKAGKWGYPELT